MFSEKVAKLATSPLGVWFGQFMLWEGYYFESVNKKESFSSFLYLSITTSTWKHWKFGWKSWKRIKNFKNRTNFTWLITASCMCFMQNYMICVSPKMLPIKLATKTSSLVTVSIIMVTSRRLKIKAWSPGPAVSGTPLFLFTSGNTIN